MNINTVPGYSIGKGVKNDLVRHCFMDLNSSKPFAGNNYYD